MLQFWLIDSLLRHNPLTSIYRNDEEAEAAVTNGSNGGEGHFRDSTNASVEQGQSRQSWWVRDPPSHHHHRDDSQSRLMSDHDHDDSSREDEHAYPPTPSATSSVAQLDAQNKGTTIEAVLDDTQISSSIRDDKAVESPKESADGPVIRPDYTAEATNEDEEDAWDNWNEDSRSTEQTRPST